MEVIAKSKYTRGSAQRARLVADTIRGKRAVYASQMLNYLPKRASEKVQKALDSAIANAINNFGLSLDALVVKNILVDDAPMFKRSRAQSRGRMRMILKRNSHITVILSDEVDGAVAKKETKKTKTVEADKAKTATNKTTRAKKSVKSEITTTDTDSK